MNEKRWVKAAALTELEAADGLLSVRVEGMSLVLYAVEGDVYATEDLCTHGQARLSDGYLDGHLIECPLHQGLFDVRTGEPAGAPCTEAVRSFPAMKKDGAVFVEVEC